MSRIYERTKERTQPEILIEMREGLLQAIAACSSFIHEQRDPRFMILRDALELMQDMVTLQAPRSLKMDNSGGESKKIIIPGAGISQCGEAKKVII